MNYNVLVECIQMLSEKKRRQPVAYIKDSKVQLLAFDTTVMGDPYLTDAGPEYTFLDIALGEHFRYQKEEYLKVSKTQAFNLKRKALVFFERNTKISLTKDD